REPRRPAIQPPPWPHRPPRGGTTRADRGLLASHERNPTCERLCPGALGRPAPGTPCASDQTLDQLSPPLCAARPVALPAFPAFLLAPYRGGIRGEGWPLRRHP